MAKALPARAKQIDKEAKHWRRKREEFAAALATAEGRVKGLRAKRESLLLDAKANEDRRAQQELAKATTELQGAAREYGDARSIVQQIDGKLTELERDRRQAIKDAACDQLEGLIAERLDVDKQIEEATKALCELLIRWSQIRCAQSALVSEHHLPGPNIHARTFVLDSYLTSRLHQSGLLAPRAILDKTMKTRSLVDAERDMLEISMRLARTGKVSEARPVPEGENQRQTA